MIFGRPMRTPFDQAYDISTPLSPTSAMQPHKLRFFEEFSALHEILADILSTFYTRLSDKDEQTTSQLEQLDHLTRLDRRLSAWHADVAPYLRFPILNRPESDVHSDSFALARQANVLYLR